MRRVVAAAVMVALWVALWGDITVGNVVAGVLVAVFVVVVSPVGRPPDREIRLQPLRLVYFAGYFLVALVRSSIAVAVTVVMPRRRTRSGVLAVPMPTDSEALLTLTGNVITLTPGTLTIDAVQSPPTLFVHVLDLRDVETCRAELVALANVVVRTFEPSPRRAR